jgi:hypothetical protein
MQNSPLFRTAARSAIIAACTLAALAAPRRADAQYNAPPLSNVALGEKYRIELAGTLWNPAIVGAVSSDEFGIPGDTIDFVSDLGFEKTRFKDFRIVLRPARKHKFRAQYTPITYMADTLLKRTVVFNGIRFDAIPVTAQFDWKVWRLGYEYDFIYRDRGFIGLLVDVRATEFLASLKSIGRAEFVSAKVPLPALGLVGRGYILPGLALHFEVSGMKAPPVDPDYDANYFDWDIHSTINLTNNVGFEVGWRKMTTYINIENDKGDFKFQGMWFGAAVRY